jgi:type IV pilus assembly protein PilM
VDLGTSAVKLAQLRISQSGIDLVAAGEIEIPRSCRNDASGRLDHICQGMPGVLNSNAFKGRQAILSLPAQETFVQHVKIPKLPPHQAPLAVQNELQGKLPYPIEDAIIRHITVGEVYGEGETKQEAIVVAVSRRTLETYLAMARRAKLDVIGVDIEPFAIVECFSRLFQRADDAQRAVLFVDIGAASTQVVLAHGKDPVFARNLAIGGEQLDQAVAERMKVPFEKAQAARRELTAANADTTDAEELYQALEEPLNSMADEMTKCLRYYESVFRKHSIDRAIFVGGQACDKRLCQSLAQRLALPAQVGDPLMRIRSATAQLAKVIDRRTPQPQWAVAVGLSLGAMRAA